jgi:hypothetical protein
LFIGGLKKAWTRRPAGNRGICHIQYAAFPPLSTELFVLDIGENHINTKETGRWVTVSGRARTTEPRGRIEAGQYARWRAIGD